MQAEQLNTYQISLMFLHAGRTRTTGFAESDVRFTIAEVGEINAGC